MSVSDSGNEVLRKSAVVIDGGTEGHSDKGSEYLIRVNDADSEALLSQILGALGGAVTVTQRIYNETIASANVEQSLALPTDIVGYLIRTRGNGELKLSHVSGESGSKYLTIPRRASYKDVNRYSSLTLYFQSPSAGEVVEIVAWEA